ncbi:minor capsid protein [Lactococcus cremoris]
MAEDLSYWQKRYLKIKADAIAAAELEEKEARKRIAPAKKELIRLTERFVSRYSLEDGALDETAVKKKLRGVELKAWNNTLDEWERKAKAGGYDRELNLEYYRSRVSRIKTLQAQMSVVMAEYAAKESPKLASRLMNTFKSTYYRNIYTQQQQRGKISGNFAKFDDKMLKQVIAKPWMGDTFSKRIWKNYTQTLPTVLTDTLSKGVVLGYNTDRLVKMVQGRFVDVSRSNIQRLIHTEMAHISEEATYEGYVEDGVEEYEYMATLEKNTCEICQALDGTIHKIEDKKEGVNYPVIHARCRCTTGAYYKDAELLKNRKRAARDPETGKAELVDKMSFDDWAKKVGIEHKVPNQPAMSKANKTAKGNLVEIMGKTNMRIQVGGDNYDNFINHLNKADEKQQELYSIAGEDLTFGNFNQTNAAMNNTVFLRQRAFDGQAGFNQPLGVVYHENGHALDYIAAKYDTEGAGYVIGKGKKTAKVTFISSNPKYNLAQTIDEDLRKYVHGDLKEVKKPRQGSKDFQKKYDEFWNYRTKAKENREKFLKDMLEIKKRGVHVSSLSDILEAATEFGSSPLGGGHGASYWKVAGNRETEFFAEISDILNTDPEQYELIKKILPNAVEKYHEMVDDAIKIIKQKKGK